jgi:hypothetical protein
MGTWGQVLGRGLVPRLSIGTLQLLIRCSSIHFLPSRSFPVSTSGALKGAAFGFGGSPAYSLSCAAAGNARQIVSKIARERKVLMDGLAKPQGLLDAAQARRRLTEQYRDLPFHPEPAAHRSVYRSPETPTTYAGTANKERRMNTKRLILAGCAVMVLSVGTALAGPCDSGGRAANMKDAGAGPTPGNTGQTVGANSSTDQHPPTSTMNRATGDVATSSQDAQKQMQGEPTAVQQAQGAKPTGQMADKGC